MAAKVEGEVERVQEVGGKGRGRGSLLVNLAARGQRAWKLSSDVLVLSQTILSEDSPHRHCYFHIS